MLSLAPLDRLLFAGLMCWVDRQGRVLDRPFELKQRIMSADDVDLDAALNRLQRKGLLRRYRVGKLRAIQLSPDVFLQEQTFHKNEPESGIPPPPPVVPRGSRRVLTGQNPGATLVPLPVAGAGTAAGSITGAVAKTFAVGPTGAPVGASPANSSADLQYEYLEQDIVDEVTNAPQQSLAMSELLKRLPDYRTKAEWAETLAAMLKNKKLVVTGDFRSERVSLPGLKVVQ